MKKFICMVSAIMCLSCGIVDFSDSDSVRVNPSKVNQVIQEDEDIYVKFSFSPDHISAQAALDIQDRTGSLAGSFTWKENTMVFRPKKALEVGQRYFFKYAGEVSDTAGKSHIFNKYIPFFYKKRQLVKPSVIRMNPADGSTFQPQAQIVFFFSSPMNAASFLSGFSVSPNTGHSEEWNDDCTQLILRPESSWEEYTVYRFSFSDEIVSSDGVPIAESSVFSLCCSSGASLPSVLSADTALNDGLDYPVLLSGLEGIKERDAIRISFSVPMEAEAAEDALLIRPDIAGHTCWTDECTLVFIPDEAWQGQTLYSLRIGTSARSVHALNLPDIFEVSFTPDTYPAALLRIEGKAADGFPLSSFDPSHEVDIDVGSDTLPENIYTFSFVFNQDFKTAEEKEAICSGIKIKGLFPPALTAPKVMSAFWSGDSMLQMTYTGFVPDGRIYSLNVGSLEKITLRTR